MESNLRIEEYKFIHDMIKENLSLLEKNELTCFAAVGSLIVFLYSRNGVDEIDQYLIFTVGICAIALMLFGFAKFYSYEKMLYKYHAYLIRNYEKKDSSIGWSQYHRGDGQKPMHAIRFTIWGVVSIGVVCVVLTKFAFHLPITKYVFDICYKNFGYISIVISIILIFLLFENLLIDNLNEAS